MGLNELLFILLAVASTWCAVQASKVSVGTVFVYIAITTLLMNHFVLKQVVLFGWKATATDGLGIGIGCALALLREYYGANAAKQAIYIGVGSVAFATVIGTTILAFDSQSEPIQRALSALWLPAPRIFAASIFAFFVSDRLEVYWFGLLKDLCGGKCFTLRYAICQIGAQAIDTILFTWLGLAGLLSDLTEVAAIAFGMKLLTIAISSGVVHVLNRNWKAMNGPAI